MTYKELLVELQKLNEEQLNGDVCLYNTFEYQYELNAELVYSTEECHFLNLNHPIIRF